MSKLLVIDFTGEQELLRTVADLLTSPRIIGNPRYLVLFPKGLDIRLQDFYGTYMRGAQCVITAIPIWYDDVEIIISINEFRDLLAAGRTLRDIWGGAAQVPEVREEEAVPEPRERDVPVLSRNVRSQRYASWVQQTNSTSRVLGTSWEDWAARGSAQRNSTE